MKSIETEDHAKFARRLRLCPRIIVFRPFVDQLPELDVGGPTPVARSREFEQLWPSRVEAFYNYHRPHAAFAGQTPYEALRERLQ